MQERFENPTKEITATYTKVDLHNDLDHDEWERSEALSIVRYWSGELATHARHAEARLLWSDEALHLRYTCPQAEPLIINGTPQTKAKTIGLWDRDVCEIYIAPDPDAVEHYYEFEAAPTGEWLDVAIQWKPEGRESDWKFNSGMTTAARVENDRVIIAMRIPWGVEIPQPHQGGRWRVNLFRCVGKDPDRGYLAWQPTKTPKPGFHVPQAFGWLVFG